MGGKVQRAHLVTRAGEKSLIELAFAVDNELQHISEQVGLRKTEIVYTLPTEDEGQPGDHLLLIDSEGEIDDTDKRARYLLYKFDDEWYYIAKMTKLQRKP